MLCYKPPQLVGETGPQIKEKKKPLYAVESTTEETQIKCYRGLEEDAVGVGGGIRPVTQMGCLR